jgi:hypothetical protein
MTTLAYLLPFVALIVAAARAPLSAVPLAPPCLAILASMLELVDLSSASHPLRYLVPAASCTLALLVLSLATLTVKRRDPRTVAASILILASTGPDVLALLAWQLPGPWILIPFQVGICLAIIAVLLVPKGWLSWMKL